MNISSRCKPPPQYQRRPWSRSCACSPWANHGACRVAVVVWRCMRGLGSSTAQCGWAHSVPYSCGARVRHSSAVVGAPERPAQQANTIRNARNGARGAGRQASSACNQDHRGVRQGQSQTNTFELTTCQVLLHMWEGRAQSRGRCTCGRGGPSPAADVAGAGRGGPIPIADVPQGEHSRCVCARGILVSGKEWQGRARPLVRGRDQPRSQHSRVGMLRQNNQHSPARAAVLAAVLRHTASLSAVFFIIK